MFYHKLFTHERARYYAKQRDQEPLPFCSPILRGVIRIHNLKTEKSLVTTSENLTQDITRILSDLEAGTFPNQELQSEYKTQLGPKAFRVETLLIAEKNENLHKLLLLGKEKLLDLAVPFYHD